MNEPGKIIFVVGLLIALVGLLIWAGVGKWLGRLPGDIQYTRGDCSFHFPVVTCILVSALLSLLLWFFRR